MPIIVLYISTKYLFLEYGYEVPVEVFFWLGFLAVIDLANKWIKK